MKKNTKTGVFRLSSIFKILCIIVLMLVVLAGTFTGAYVLSVIKNAPQIDPQNYRSLINETSKVYDDENALIQTLVLNEFSEYVTLDKIPKNLQNALIAVEDERFYTHSAVDFRRIVGALVSNLKAGRIVEGGSTITMQLAKNLYTNSSKTTERKLADIYYSFQLENNLSKEQILEAYLNSAGFSKGTVGVQAASKSFFDKDVSELTLAECALVAGITNRPEKYSPYNRVAIDPNDNLEQIELVLVPAPSSTPNSDETIAIGQKLLDLGRIDKFDFNQIKNNIIKPVKAEFNPTSKERQELILKLMEKQGYITAQEHKEASEQPIKIKIGAREQKGVSSFYVDEVKNEAIQILKNELGYTEEEATTKLYTGGFSIYSSMNLKMQQHFENTVANKKFFPGTWVNDAGLMQPQVAAVLMDQHTGQVKALIGGRGISGNSNFNRATSPRQPGSSIKPISSYLTSFKYGGTAADIYLDAPLPKNIFGSNPPKNIGNSYVGWTSARNLLRRSSNVGSILVARDVGADYNAGANKNFSISKGIDDVAALTKIMDTLEEMGVTSLVHPNKDKPSAPNDLNFSALALGGMTHGISPLEMAGAYTTLANEGKYQKPTFIDKIVSSSGEIVYENKQTSKEIISKENAWILTDMLQDVVTNGTGTNANFGRMPIAGKTGTTNDKKDAWFVGYTPYYLCSVFIGNDRNEPMPFMSSISASLWRGLMKPIHDDLDRKDFEKPDTVERKYVRGLGTSEYFAPGTSPHYTNKFSMYNPMAKKKTTDEDKSNEDNSNNENTKKKSSKDNEENSKDTEKKSSKSKKSSDKNKNTDTEKKSSTKSSKSKSSKSKTE